MSIFACASAAAQSCATWTKFNVLPRYGHALAYDSVRGVTVLFGGTDGNSAATADTWEWDGFKWALRSTAGPAPQPSPAMAFDSVRGVTVMFGGKETWEWDGQSWTLRSTTGPSLREGHALVFDAANGVTVLFGGSHLISGQGIVYYADTWTWNGDAWTQVSNEGPPGRRSHAMAYDADRQKTVLFGGSIGQTYLADTWEWNGKVWVQRNVNGPRARRDHAMAFHAGRHTVVLTGGYFDGYDAATWEWDGESWTFADLESHPSSRARHAIAYDSQRAAIVLFGGTDGVTCLGDTWQFSGASDAGQWELQANTLIPLPRAGHTMVFDSNRGATLMFGGRYVYSYGIYYYFNDTWEWNGDAWSLLATSGPPPRANHGMAFDSARGVTVLFGGFNNGDLGDTWEWDGATWSLKSTIGPSPRHGMQLAYDSVRHVTVLFGGSQFGTPLGETWEWNGETWTLRNVLGLGARYYYAMAYDPVAQVTVLHGGYNDSTWYDQTWEWTGQSWTQLSSNGPGARTFHSMVFDQVLQKPIIFGGFSQQLPIGNDTWKWNGESATWSNISMAGPGVRLDLSMAFDSNRSVTVLFGGRDDILSGFNDTWELSTSTHCADINLDGMVNSADLLAVINAWGPCPTPPSKCVADINGDGLVNVADLLLVLSNWG